MLDGVLVREELARIYLMRRRYHAVLNRLLGFDGDTEPDFLPATHRPLVMFLLPDILTGRERPGRGRRKELELLHRQHARCKLYQRIADAVARYGVPTKRFTAIDRLLRDRTRLTPRAKLPERRLNEKLALIWHCLGNDPIRPESIRKKRLRLRQVAS